MVKHTRQAARGPKQLHWILGPLAARPRLAIAFVIGVAAGLAAHFVFTLQASTSVVAGWDATCLLFAAFTLWAMRHKEPRHITATAVAQDVGRGLILGLVICAAIASVAAVAIELTFAKDTQGAEKIAHVGLAFATVAASWFMVQLIFTLHYAHEYYAPDDSTDGVRGGLKFPGVGEPDYWDFLHFALVIGVASQTADVAFTSRSLRRIGTLHCVLAFTFNTVVLALTINLVAGLL